VEERYKNEEVKCRIINYNTAFPSVKRGISKEN
jgi:hypothetical protein